MKSADGSHPGVKEELYEAVRRVLLCLDACTDLLLTPGGASEDDPRLRLLQQEVTDHNAAQTQDQCNFFISLHPHSPVVVFLSESLRSVFQLSW